MNAEGVLITRGEDGMWLSHAGVDGYLSSSAREVADVTGAGDTVIATLALAIAAGATATEGAARQRGRRYRRWQVRRRHRHAKGTGRGILTQAAAPASTSVNP